MHIFHSIETQNVGVVNIYNIYFIHQVRLTYGYVFWRCHSIRYINGNIEWFVDRTAQTYRCEPHLPLNHFQRHTAKQINPRTNKQTSRITEFVNKVQKKMSLALCFMLTAFVLKSESESSERKCWQACTKIQLARCGKEIAPQCVRTSRISLWNYIAKLIRAVTTKWQLTRNRKSSLSTGSNCIVAAKKTRIPSILIKWSSVCASKLTFSWRKWKSTWKRFNEKS